MSQLSVKRPNQQTFALNCSADVYVEYEKQRKVSQMCLDCCSVVDILIDMAMGKLCLISHVIF